MKIKIYYVAIESVNETKNIKKKLIINIIFFATPNN